MEEMPGESDRLRLIENALCRLCEKDAGVEVIHAINITNFVRVGDFMSLTLYKRPKDKTIESVFDLTPPCVQKGKADTSLEVGLYAVKMLIRCLDVQPGEDGRYLLHGNTRCGALSKPVENIDTKELEWPLLYFINVTLGLSLFALTTEAVSGVGESGVEIVNKSFPSTEGEGYVHVMKILADANTISEYDDAEFQRFRYVSLHRARRAE